MITSGPEQVGSSGLQPDCHQMLGGLEQGIECLSVKLT